MMYKKAMMFKDEAIAEKIMSADNEINVPRELLLIPRERPLIPQEQPLTPILLMY